MTEHRVEIDPVSGTPTTGHDWNGIKELDTAVPRAVLLFIIVTHVWAVFYWILMPTWPLVWTYTKGVLGIDQRQVVERELTAAQAAQSDVMLQIESMSFDDIRASEPLMSFVGHAGYQLFGDNCAACHGRDARGGLNYPDLTDDDWLWGGDPEAIAETLRVGINTSHSEARFAQMPAFGTDQMLTGAEVRNVARYVYTLSHPDYSTPENIDEIDAGRELFADNCTGCHGETGTGMQELGAPNLTDAVWIYGGELETIIATIHRGRQGHMPTWDERLSPEEIKILALYVHSLNVENS
jgi:cytochrome c oxidase cbb3-type subunit 3